MRLSVRVVCVLLLVAFALTAADQPLKMSLADYEDRVHGAWLGQIIGTLLGFRFEGQVASSPMVVVDEFSEEGGGRVRDVLKTGKGVVDDDWYYELVALRAFEKYGIDMTLDQLGEQWHANSAGSWGSSEQARLQLSAGVKGSQAGHPRYNRVWWTIGPQFSGDTWGMLAPGDVNLAGKIARKYGHINGHAEAVDGAVFVSGMISLAFRETDPKKIVREAAQLIHPLSPYRQCLNLVISMADAGKSAQEIFDVVEDRWHIEYPPMNNAVPNGGLVAASLWFGEGDFLKSVNLAFRAADFSDADCNAANVGAVVGAMKGIKALPAKLVEQLGDRIVGDRMGPVELTPAVDESISDIAGRITKVGLKMLAANGSKVTANDITVASKPAVTQEAELFKLADLTEYWNKDWKLERAGFGGVPDRIPNAPRGYPKATYIEGDVLATWPRDEVRGVVLRRTVRLSNNPRLRFEAGADTRRGWQLAVFVNNSRVLAKSVEGAEANLERTWEKIDVDLSEFRGKEVEIRLYQRTLGGRGGRTSFPGNAYWRGITLQ
jgi:hypothetical protein